MKIENKKVKQNDLTNQEFISNFCFIKSLIHMNFLLYKSNKAIFKLFHICFILFCRKFNGEFKYDISFSYWALLDPIPGFTAEYVEIFIKFLIYSSF